MLIHDQLAYAQSSRPISDKELEPARTLDFSLAQISVTIDDLPIVIYPELDVDGLSLEQLKSIYMGKITNWSQLGDLYIFI